MESNKSDGRCIVAWVVNTKIDAPEIISKAKKRRNLTKENKQSRKSQLRSNGKESACAADLTEFQTEESIGFINRLPDELLLYILKYVSWQGLINCSETNQKFNRLAKDSVFWKSVDLRGRQIKESDLHKLIDLKTQYLHLAETKMKFHRGDNFDATETPLSRLRYLTLSFLQPFDVVRSLLYRCHLLEGLSLHGHQLDNETCFYISRNANLKFLDFDECRMSADGVGCILNGCTKLVELNLTLPKKFKDNTQTTKFACTLLPSSLLKLDIWGSYYILDKDIENVVARCPKLVELSVYDCCDQLTENALMNLTKNLANLKILRCTHWKLIAVNDFVNNCKHLEKLHIYQFPKTNLDDFKRKYKLTNLEASTKSCRSPVADPRKWHPILLNENFT